MRQTLAALTRTDLISGLVKGFTFGGLTSIICCYYGMNTSGGPMGLGRFTTLAVVTSMVVVVISDAVLTTFFVTYKSLLEGWLG